MRAGVSQLPTTIPTKEYCKVRAEVSLLLSLLRSAALRAALRAQPEVSQPPSRRQHQGGSWHTVKQAAKHTDKQEHKHKQEGGSWHTVKHKHKQEHKHKQAHRQVGCCSVKENAPSTTNPEPPRCWAIKTFVKTTQAVNHGGKV